MDEKLNRPTADQLRMELERVGKKKRGSVIGRFFLILLILILIAAVACVFLLPSFIIYGDSMAPTLTEGDLVLCWKADWPKGEIRRGDMIALSYGDRVLIKRVIALSGDTVEILSDGTVLLNGSAISEFYAAVAPQGAMDTDNPCKVPENSYYVLGDNRGSSVDSRNSIVGFVSEGDAIGRIFIRIWPLNRITIIR